MIDAMVNTGSSALDGHAASRVGEARPLTSERSGAGRRASRSDRFSAAVSDLLRLAGGSVFAFLVAVAYLFWRTAWGATDAGATDTAIATALVLAPAPVWSAWLLAAAIDSGATPGQSRHGLAIRTLGDAGRRARIGRFAAHPLSLPVWLWLAALAFLGGAGLLSWIFAVTALLIGLAGLGSAILIAVGRRPFHDLIARTTVEERP